MQEVQIPFHDGDLEDIRQAAEVRARLEAAEPNSPEFRQAMDEWETAAKGLAHMLIYKLDARKG